MRQESTRSPVCSKSWAISLQHLEDLKILRFGGQVWNCKKNIWNNRSSHLFINFCCSNNCYLFDVFLTYFVKRKLICNLRTTKKTAGARILTLTSLLETFLVNPMGPMHGIFANINHKNQQMCVNKIPYMDPMGFFKPYLSHAIEKAKVSLQDSFRVCFYRPGWAMWFPILVLSWLY